MLDNDEAGNAAEAILLFRRDRDEIFRGYFLQDDPWSIVLELFLADTRGVSVTLREIVLRNGLSTKVATRWILHLIQVRLVSPMDEVDIDCSPLLTASALCKLEALFKRSRLGRVQRRNDVTEL